MEDALKAKIDEVKAKGLPVFSLPVSGTSYIYRGISRLEFRTLQKEMTVLAESIRKKYSEDEPKMNAELSSLKERSEEELVMLATLSPEIKSVTHTDSLPAGLIGRLADLITIASGFTETVEEPTQL